MKAAMKVAGLVPRSLAGRLLLAASAAVLVAVVLAGLGNLGRAIANYRGFSPSSFRIAALFEPVPEHPAGIHPSAVIAPEAVIDPSAHVGPFASIGARSHVGAGAVIGPGCVIGEDCVVEPGSVVSQDVADGQRVAGNPARPSRPNPEPAQPA